MRTQELDWTHLAVDTPQQRIRYSVACQNHFVESRAQPAAQRTTFASVEGAGCVEPPRFLAMNELIALPSQLCFQCAVCGADSERHDDALVLANPYSRWVVLRCRGCAVSQ